MADFNFSVIFSMFLPPIVWYEKCYMNRSIHVPAAIEEKIKK